MSIDFKKTYYHILKLESVYFTTIYRTANNISQDVVVLSQKVIINLSFII